MAQDFHVTFYVHRGPTSLFIVILWRLKSHCRRHVNEGRIVGKLLINMGSRGGNSSLRSSSSEKYISTWRRLSGTRKQPTSFANHSHKFPGLQVSNSLTKTTQRFHNEMVHRIKSTGNTTDYAVFKTKPLNNASSTALMNTTLSGHFHWNGSERYVEAKNNSQLWKNMSRESASLKVPGCGGYGSYTGKDNKQAMPYWYPVFIPQYTIPCNG
eukprot:gene12980-14315_t